MRRALAIAWLVLACSEPYANRSAGAVPVPTSAATRAPEFGTPVAPLEADLPAADDPKAGELHYVEILLGGAKPDQALPMIVAIHGLGDDPRNFGHLFDTFTEPARLILPRGIDPREGGGFSWFPLRARDPDIDQLASGIASAADKLAASIDVLAREKKTAGKPILTGFSQGGMLSFAVAVRHPGSIAVALPVGGWLPPPLWPKSAPGPDAPAIIALHGSDDGAVKFEPTERAVEALAKLGWKASLVAYPGVGHVITPEIHRDLDDRIVDAVHAASKAKPKK